jgi:hypothetical protein
MRKMKINRASTTGYAILLVGVFGLLLSAIEPSRGRPLGPPATMNVDLRSKIAGFDIAVRDQGARNTCSVFATTFLLEYETAKSTNQKGLDFSEDYLNAVTDIVTNAKGDGDFFSNILNGYLKFGTVAQSDFPNTPSYNPNNVPSASLLDDGKQNVKFVPVFIRENPGGENPWGLTDDHVNQIVAQLDAGRPVAAGWRLGKSGIENAVVLGQQVWSKNIAKNANDYSGHSMPIVGYVKARDNSAGYFIIRNSGGAGWGESGYWYCTFDFAKQNIADVFYLKPKTPQLSVRLPEIIRRPTPSYMRIDEMRKILNVNVKAGTKNLVIK